MRCKTCRKFFVGDSTRKFCSRSCAATFNNKGVRRHKGTLPTCKGCGKDLKLSERLYCSNKCQQNFELSKKVERASLEQSLDFLPTQHTRKRVFCELVTYECSICGISEWLDTNLVLIMDHINGDASDNKLSNLRLVCPNCDSQLPTYKNKNRGNGRHARKLRYQKGQSY